MSIIFRVHVEHVASGCVRPAFFPLQRQGHRNFDLLVRVSPKSAGPLFIFGQARVGKLRVVWKHSMGFL